MDLEASTYVVNSHQSAVRPADLAAGICETLESLRGGHLVDEMAVWGSIVRNHRECAGQFGIPI